MTTKIFDGSVRVPVSKQTAIAMSGGCGFDITPRGNNADSDNPIPYHTATDLMYSEDDKMLRKVLKQVHGYKWGFLTVLGVYPYELRTKGKCAAIYVVRCRCGRYSRRKLKTIRNPSNIVDACEKCRTLIDMKRHDHYRTTGKDITWQDVAGIHEKKPLIIK